MDHKLVDQLLIEQFLEMKLVESSISKHTLEAYRSDLILLKRMLSIDLRQAKAEHLSQWSLQMADKAAATVARQVSTCRQFYQFLQDQRYRPDNPAERLSAPKQRRTLPKTIEVREVVRLLDYAESLHGWRGHRLSCLLELLYGCGLRVSELVGLPLSAYSHSEPLFLIKGKGGRERVVPIHDKADAAWQRWLRTRQNQAGANSRWAFPTRAGQGYLTRQRVGQLLRSAAVAVGLDERQIHPHLFRHAFAGHLLAGGADLRTVQQLLGHADIVTTQIYTHVVTDQKRQTLMTRHPLGQES